MAKFEIKLRKRNITNEELIMDLKSVLEITKNFSVTQADYRTYGQYSIDTYYRRFGSWFEALKSAGLEKTRSDLNIPIDQLFGNIVFVWEKLGRQPTYNDMRDGSISKYSISTYDKRFGSWNKALNEFSEFLNNTEYSKIEVEIISENLKRKTSRNINWRLRAQILIRDGCICQMCGASPSKDSSVILHVDHIKPWSKGGETVIENLQTLCSVCNIGKSDLD